VTFGFPARFPAGTRLRSVPQVARTSRRWDLPRGDGPDRQRQKYAAIARRTSPPWSDLRRTPRRCWGAGGRWPCRWSALCWRNGRSRTTCSCANTPSRPL